MIPQNFLKKKKNGKTKLGRPTKTEEELRDELVLLSYQQLLQSLKSHKVKKAKKIEIALAIAKRRMPQDVNVENNISGSLSGNFMVKLISPDGSEIKEVSI